jgi:cyanate permease
MLSDSHQQSGASIADSFAGPGRVSTGKNRWLILCLLWLLYATFGIINRSLSALVTPILRDLQLSYTEMGFILGSWQLTYIPAALVAGALLDRWGVRKSLTAGAVVVGLSSALRYFPQGFAGMLGAVALFGAGGSMISVGCPKAIFSKFKGRTRGTAVGIYLTGSWTGSILVLIFTNSLIMPWMEYSWRHTFAFYGFLAFTAAFLWWFLSKETLPARTEKEEGITKIFVRLIRVRNVQIALLVGFLTFTVIHGFFNWLPKLLETGGFSPSLAGILAAVPLIAGVPSLLIISHLIPPPSRGRFLAWAGILTIVALATAVTASGIVQLAGLALFGFLTPPFVSIMTLILMDTPEIGSGSMGSAVGMFYCVAEMGGFAGPFAMGALVDATGGFLSGVILLAVLCLVISLLSLLLKTAPLPKGSLR